MNKKEEQEWKDLLNSSPGPTNKQLMDIVNYAWPFRSVALETLLERKPKNSLILNNSPLFGREPHLGIANQIGDYVLKNDPDLEDCEDIVLNYWKYKKQLTRAANLCLKKKTTSIKVLLIIMKYVESLRDRAWRYYQKLNPSLDHLDAAGRIHENLHSDVISLVKENEYRGKDLEYLIENFKSLAYEKVKKIINEELGQDVLVSIVIHLPSLRGIAWKKLKRKNPDNKVLEKISESVEELEEEAYKMITRTSEFLCNEIVNRYIKSLK